MTDWRASLRLIRSDCERLNQHATQPITLSPLRYMSLLLYPQISALALHRIAHCLHARGRRHTAYLLSRLGRILTGANIHPASEIGSHCLIVHTTGLHLMARLGDNATLFAQIYVGPRDDGAGDSIDAAPTIGNNTVVSSRVTIIGHISIADDVHVGPCSLINQSILQSGCIVQQVAGKTLRVFKGTKGILP
jgi:serine O-acetyltransferase